MSISHGDRNAEDDASSEHAPLQIGSRLGRYVIVQRIGEGGMGIVYEAHDPELGRNVAVKVLWPARRTVRRIERLRREARAMAKVSHPNVVQVFDVGDVGDQVFLAMELVRGRNLAAWLAERDRLVHEVLPVMIDVARGLAAAHTAGLVHRDVKPGNVLVDEHGLARIGDFGLAHAATAPDTTGRPGVDSSAELIDAVMLPDVSADGAAGPAGTPSHMAPEQHALGPVDARTDQYGFCVTLWQALFGKLPFEGRDMSQLYVAKLETTPRVPVGSRVPAWLIAACLRGLAIAPEDRFASMDALIVAITPRRSRRWRIGVIALAAAVIGIGLSTTRGASPCDEAARELDALWHGPRRAALDTVVGNAGTWLAPSWATAQRRIDDWTAQWIGLRRDSCLANAASTSDEVDATHACLREHRTAFATLLDLVEQGDAAVLRDLVASVAALPSPRECERSRAARKEPDDPADRRRVHAMAETLARAETLGRAGRHADALALADTARAEADALDWAPLRAQAEAVRGTMLRGLGEHDEAHRVIEGAHHLAQQLGDDALALSTATQLTYLVGWDLVRLEDAETWARHGFTALHRNGDDPAAEAALLDAEGAMLRRGGRYDQARTELGRARDLWHAMPGQELRFASTLSQLAGLEISVGRYDAAREAYDRALEIQTAMLGPDHPGLATTLGGIAIVDHMLGENASAKILLERAIVLRERGLGPDHPQLAGPLNNLGIVLLRLDDHAEALAVHRRALAIRERHLEPDHADIAESLNNIGVVLQEQSRYPEAEIAFVRALTIHERTLGPDHPNNVGLLDNIGIVAREQDQLEKAERWHRRALAIAEERLGADHVGTANASLGVAEAIAESGRCLEALAFLERAEAIYVSTGADPSRRAEATFGRGRCLVTLGKRAEGLVLVDDARAQFGRVSGGGVRGIAAIDAWLAKLGE